MTFKMATVIRTIELWYFYTTTSVIKDSYALHVPPFMPYLIINGLQRRGDILRLLVVFLNFSLAHRPRLGHVTTQVEKDKLLHEFAISIIHAETIYACTWNIWE